MSLIDFTLRPLADVMPWGRPDDPSDKHLSWFGLTDGWYSIDAKSARLFQYTKEIMMHLDPQSTGRGPYSDWTDYQVVRIYEDLLEMLPDTLLEVPDSVHTLVQSVEARREWNRSLAWVRDAEENTALDDSLETATYWASRRKLDSLYLIDGHGFGCGGIAVESICSGTIQAWLRAGYQGGQRFPAPNRYRSTILWRRFNPSTNG